MWSPARACGPVSVTGSSLRQRCCEGRRGAPPGHPRRLPDAADPPRHILAHGYFDIDPEVVWNVVDRDAATLEVALAELIGE
ncbi:MAG: HepT-like ribonuclease domain-containing protein [Actinomycetota bacterium]